MGLNVFMILVFYVNCAMTLAQSSFYSGFINDTIPVKMKLQLEAVYESNDSLSYRAGYEYFGEYEYVSIGKKIKLEGKNGFVSKDKISKDSIIRLNEYTGLECTGYFAGKFNKQGSFVGTWYAKDGIIKYPFLLKLIDNVKIVYLEEKSLVYPQLNGLKNKSVEKLINQNLRSLISGVVIEEFKKDCFQKHEYGFKILYSENNIFSYSSTHTLYDDTTYQAFLMHASGSFKCLNLITGKKLKYEDVLINGSEDEIDKRIKDEVKENCNYTPDSIHVKAIRDNICVTDSGLLFPYNGCIMQGKFDQDWVIEIPFGDVKKMLKPDGLLQGLSVLDGVK